MGDLVDTPDVPLSKEEEEWNLMKKDPYYTDDPLCHTGGEGGNYGRNTHF